MAIQSKEHTPQTSVHVATYIIKQWLVSRFLCLFSEVIIPITEYLDPKIFVLLEISGLHLNKISPFFSVPPLSSQRPPQYIAVPNYHQALVHSCHHFSVRTVLHLDELHYSLLEAALYLNIISACFSVRRNARTGGSTVAHICSAERNALYT